MKSPTQDPGKLANFIIFSQREFLLNLSKNLREAGVSFSQFYLLGYLCSRKSAQMSDIARKMGCSTAAATGCIDQMEKLGYTERSHATDDRRKVMVSITAKGIALVSSLRSALQMRVAEALKGKEGENPIDDILDGEK